MISGRKRVAVFTGCRSELALLKPIMRSIAADPALELIVIAGGDRSKTDSIRTVTDDGFHVAWILPIRPTPSLEATADAVGRTICDIADALTVLRPQFVVVYGDRFEAFAAVTAASTLGIAVAHIEGGDYTEGGNLDDAYRHAATKLAHLHFATSEQSAERIRRMGEEPWRVHNVGLPTLDLCAAHDFETADEVANALELDPDKPVVLLCQHSVALKASEADAQIVPTCRAVARSVMHLGAQAVALHPNQDAGNAAVISAMRALLDGHARIHVSLSQRRFHGLLSLMQRSGGVFVGNSSAAIKEAPFFGVRAVNVGTRQRGRLRGESVIDVDYDETAVFEAIRGVLHADAPLCGADNPYGAGNAGPRIAETLASTAINHELMQKRMTY